MKFIPFIFAIFLAATTGTACAQKKIDTLQQGKNIASTETTSKLSPIYTAGKCNFRLRLNGGTVSVHNGSSFQSAGYYPSGTEEWSLPMLCHPGASLEDIYNQIGAKPANDKWIDLDSKQPFKPKQHFKLIKFSGKNWEGVATTVDQIYYAPPERRSRFFNFCLVENDGPQVLCGRTQIRGVTQPDSTSKLPKIMAVLKTIVFIDSSTRDPSVPPASSK